MVQLSSLGVNVQALIASTTYAFWDVLMRTAEEAVALTRKTREQRVFLPHRIYGAGADYGIYQYTRSLASSNANSAAFMLSFGDSLGFTWRNVRGVEVRLDVGLRPIHSQVVGFRRAQAASYCFWPKTSLLELRRDWLPFCSLPGEEGPEKARPKPWHSPTCQGERRKGDSQFRTLTEHRPRIWKGISP